MADDPEMITVSGTKPGAVEMALFVMSVPEVW
jgi:hypothetical protein